MRIIDADAIDYREQCECFTQGEHEMVLVAYKANIDALPTIEQPTWISCAERLPEFKQDVLMYFENNMAVGFWCDSDEEETFWCAYTDGGWYTDCDMPLYWMPLPEPPKENE